MTLGQQMVLAFAVGSAIGVIWSIVFDRRLKETIRSRRAMSDHRITNEQSIDHPYKSRCVCGKWFYDFSNHMKYDVPAEDRWPDDAN